MATVMSVTLYNHPTLPSDKKDSLTVSIPLRTLMYLKSLINAHAVMNINLPILTLKIVILGAILAKY